MIPTTAEQRADAILWLQHLNVRMRIAARLLRDAKPLGVEYTEAIAAVTSLAQDAVLHTAKPKAKRSAKKSAAKAAEKTGDAE